MSPASQLTPSCWIRQWVVCCRGSGVITCLLSQFRSLCAAVRLLRGYPRVCLARQFCPPCLVAQLYRLIHLVKSSSLFAQKQDLAGPSGRQAAQGAKPAQSGAPASKPAAGGGNDFGRLYNLVGSLCEAEPEAKQRMLEQLEPSQRCAAGLCATVRLLVPEWWLLGPWMGLSC